MATNCIAQSILTTPSRLLRVQNVSATGREPDFSSSKVTTGQAWKFNFRHLLPPQLRASRGKVAGCQMGLADKLKAAQQGGDEGKNKDRVSKGALKATSSADEEMKKMQRELEEFDNRLVALTGPPGGFKEKLQTMVKINRLERFYPPEKLQAVVNRVDRIDFDDLASRWQMPKVLAYDLATLALYDIVVLADDSGSMAFEEGGERIEDLKVVLSKVAEVATLFDDDGIQIRFLNSSRQGNGIKDAGDAEALVSGLPFSGMTPLAMSMQFKVLEPIVFDAASRGQLEKPVLVITITDGEPTDNPRDFIRTVIKKAKKRMTPTYGPKAVAFQFAQVGRDQRAQAFLGKLDVDPEVGDIIDCTSYFEMEAEEIAKQGVTLTVEAWLVKLMVGAVDPSYDAQDE